MTVCAKAWGVRRQRTCARNLKKAASFDAAFLFVGTFCGLVRQILAIVVVACGTTQIVEQFCHFEISGGFCFGGKFLD